MRRTHNRLIALLLGLSLVVAACGGDTSDTTTPSDDGEAPATTQGEGDEPEPTEPDPGEDDPGEEVVFRSAWHEPTQPLDARQVTSGAGEIAGNLFEGLFELDEDLNPVPLGAESYETSDDGTTYTISLRQDVLWSDGTPVTAGDYEYAWKGALDPELASPTAGQLYPIVNAEAYHAGEITDPDEIGITVVDDYTIELQLEAPSPVFLATLGASAIGWPVPVHVVEQFDEPYAWTEPPHIVTNGPFALESWTHEQEMVLVPNPEYWREGPNVDQVNLRLFADPTSQGLPAFESDELDFALVPSAELERVRNDSEMGDLLDFTTVPRSYGIFVDHSHPPFDNLDVRRAFYLAVDREAIADQVLNGLTEPAWSWIPHGLPGHASDVRLEGDQAAAQQYLADAGYPNCEGFPAETMVVRTTAVEELQAQAVQAQWNEVLGCDIDLELLEAQAFRELQNGIRGGNEFDLIHLSATADSPDFTLYHNLVFGTDGEGYFPTRFSNDRYAELLETGATTGDFEAALEIYAEAEQLIIEEHTAIIPVSFENLAYVVRDGWQGLSFPFGLRNPTYEDVEWTDQ